MTDFVIMTLISDIPEMEPILAFLKWQNINYEIIVTAEVLKFTHGKPAPILVLNDMVMAKGFFNIIEYIKSEGLIQC